MQFLRTIPMLVLLMMCAANMSKAVAKAPDLTLISECSEIAVLVDERSPDLRFLYALGRYIADNGVLVCTTVFKVGEEKIPSVLLFDPESKKYMVKRTNSI